MKRILALLLAIPLLLSLTACSLFGDNGDDPTNQTGLAHEQLLEQAETYLTTARQQSDVGLTLQGEYFYGMAQASVSSLRYAVDYILWLMGEGESLADLTADAPYRNWNDIISVGMGSPIPHYFEGLVFKVQGKDAEAQTCYDRAAANPTYKETDFWYLRRMTVDELYTLRKTVLALEIEIYEEYTPRTELCSAERTGAEFSPTYHLTLAAKAAEAGENQLAYQCALNALLTNPTQAELYSAAISYGLKAGVSDAVSVLNEGLLVFPNDGRLNYLAGAVALSAGDKATAREYLTKAQAAGDENLTAMCRALLAQTESE